LSTDEPVDDLSKPLGLANRRKKKRFVLPIPWVARALAAALSLCVVVLAGWIVFVDDPYGGEPAAVITAATAATQTKVASDGQPPAKPTTPTVEAEKKTVTIIDGSTGKRQEVNVNQQSAPLPSEPAQKKSELKNEASPEALVDQRVTDTSRHGPIPKIGADGARPADIYARPVKPQASRADQPRIAIVIEGLGISANSTAEALAKLPAPVSLAFVPYGVDIERWVARARSENHEVLLQVGMEPFDYPDNDPGPQTLLTSLTAEHNVDRLHWYLARFQGYVGVTSLMGARFMATGEALSPVIREVGKRGLIFFDDGSSPRSTAAQISGSANVAFAKADAVIDAVPTTAAIDNALARLESIARSRGIAVGAASALPLTVGRIAEWAKAADARGILLVPVSMAANRAKTGS
jgi:polysaccharide deacetylase 2 family uncharacterized protein YibQ